MNKTTAFMASTALASILCMSLPLLYAGQTDFPIQDVMGNRSALHGVGFDSTVNLKEASILISYDERARVSHEIRNPQGYPGSSYTSFTYVCEDDCKPISDWEKTKDQNRTDVTSYERQLNKASLYVSVMVTDNQQLVNDLGFIKTELTYNADKEHILKEEGTYDTEEKKIIPGWIQPENMEESGGSSIPVFHDGSYYILPLSTTAMSGQNYIYRATVMNYPESYSINTNTEHNYYDISTRLKAEKLTNVSMDRNYFAMQLSSNHIFVFSEKNQKLYITKYDLNGNLKDEISIKDFHYFDTIYKNDKYLCFSYDDTIQILNTDTMQLLHVKNKQLLLEGGDYAPIHDILYKNGRIYVSMSTDSGYYTNKLLVIENGKTVYVGTLDFLKLKPSLTELPADCIPVKFRR